MATRVHELAKELGISNKAMLEKLQSMGIKASSHMNAVSDADCQAVREAIGKDGEKQAEPSEKAKRTDTGVKPEKTERSGKAGRAKSQGTQGGAKAENDAEEKVQNAAQGSVKAETVTARKVRKTAQSEAKAENVANGKVQKAVQSETRAANGAAERAKGGVKESKAAAETTQSREEGEGAGVRGKNAKAGRKKSSNSSKISNENKGEKETSARQKNQQKKKSQGQQEEQGLNQQSQPKGGAQGDRKKSGASKEKRNDRKKQTQSRNSAISGRTDAAKGGRSKNGRASRSDGAQSSDKKSSKRPDMAKPQHKNRKDQRKEQRKENAKKAEEAAAAIPAGAVVVSVPITVKGLSEQIDISTSKIIMTLMRMGIMANINQNLDEDMVQILGDELGKQIIVGAVEEQEIEEGIENFTDREDDLRPRPPIITVMGHVDHGKTSLLDKIRHSSVTASESGGITQHIGASEITHNGKRIVFLDTPGHEAFTAMRARGAYVTDIAVLVVAADDSVKPQTIEAISHAKAANVPIIVAINKIDKPGANPAKVKQDLMEYGILVEEYGGDVISVEVSAKTGEGIESLLEMILLQAEMLELRANPSRLALGTVIEARLDKQKGPVATLLVLNGTLHVGMSVVAGHCSGRIKAMTNFKGEKMKKAGPATAVEILGLTEVPEAGDGFNVVSSDKVAREIAENRKRKQREQVMQKTSGVTLEQLFSQIEQGELKELNLIIKADVMGSVGALVSSLEKLKKDNVSIKIIHTGVGAINESDVMLAGTTGAIIIGFNVRPSAAVSSMAQRDGVEIRTYSVIYEVIEEMEAALMGLLDPEFREEILGSAEIRNTFKVPNVGTVGGAYVLSGKMERNASIRLIRDGIVIHEGRIASLKRFKDDVKEVDHGFECGIGIENYNDVKEGDIVEAYRMVEVER